MANVSSATELYAHAIAMERESVKQYRELAARMRDVGHEALAELLASFAQFESEHLRVLERRTADLELPKVVPSTLFRLDVAGALAPRQVLAAVLEAERRAHAFFETIVITAADPALRNLARELALEEAEHIAVIEKLA
jgi:rubrerythrin